MLAYGTAFALGGALYTLLEILWRGYTHPSMTLTGGVCLAMIYMLNSQLAGRPLILKCAIGAVGITLIELAVGLIVNVKLHLGVWDYSRVPFNFKGQICLPYSIMWLLLSAPAFALCGLIERYFNG